MGKVELGSDGVAFARAAWRHKVLFAISTTTLTLIFAAAILSLTPRYSAQSMLLLPHVSLGKLGEVAVNSVPDQIVLRSEVEIIKSEGISQQVIDELDIGNEPEFRPEPAGALQLLKNYFRNQLKQLTRAAGQNAYLTPVWTEAELRNDALLSEYNSRLSVFNDGRSSIAYVSFWAEDPQLAAKAANSHANAYLRHQADRRMGGQRVATNWLRQEVEGRATELKAAQMAVQSFRAENGMILTDTSNARQSTVDQELAQLNQQLTAARGEVAFAAARLEQISSSVEAGSLQGTSEMINAPVLLKLRDREVEAKLALARSPGFNAAKAELSNVQALIAHELARTRQGLIADLNAANAKLALMEAQVEAAKTRKFKLDNAQVELSAREAVAASKRSIYDAVLNRFNQLLAEQRFDAADAKLISAAAVPTRAVYPKTSLYLLIGLLISGAIGLAIAYMAERFEQPRQDPRHLASQVNLRLLGSVPAVARQWDWRKHLLEDPAIWESVREIRNQLVGPQNGEGKVIAITSTLPNEGRTLLATRLARAIALCGAPTLILDANLRRPRVAGMIGIKHVRAGLSEVLLQKASVDEAITALAPLALDVLPGTAKGKLGIELIGGGAMHSLLRRLKEKYRVIVIDTPPIAAVADALAVASMADSTVLVANAAMPAELLLETAERLKQHGATLAGVVVTGVETRAQDLHADRELRAHQRGPEVNKSRHPLFSRFMNWRDSHLT